jgi:hypothetical protein
MTYPTWLPANLREFWDADDLSLYRALIVGESDGEDYIGKLAVAYTASNRKRFAAMSRLPWFHPNSHKANILAKYQFSCFWTDFKKRGATMHAALITASSFYLADVAARACLDETQTDPTIGVGGIGADHYWADGIKPPSWACDQFNVDGSISHLGFTRTVKIGRHQFYSSWAP